MHSPTPVLEPDRISGTLPEEQFADEQLLAAFERATLTREQWTHRGHVRVAYLYAVRNDLDTAAARMRGGLQRLNAAHQTPDALQRGYHETITLAFMRLIHALVQRGGPLPSSAVFCTRHPQLLDKHVLQRFYSADRLWSLEAKRTFVEPDLAPLDAAALLTPPQEA